MSKAKPTASEVPVELPPPELPAEAQEGFDEPEDRIPTAPLDPSLAAPPPRAAAPQAILRPSQLAAMIAERQKALPPTAKAIDPFKFIREEGLPNPTRLYRVVGIKKGAQTDAVEVEATDETAAAAAAIVKLGITQSHQWTFRCFVKEE